MADSNLQSNKHIIDELNDYVVNLTQSWVSESQNLFADYLEFSSRFYQYSPRNTMMLYAQNPYASLVGSYAFYRKQGYNVNRGEHGLKIFVPVPVTRFRDPVTSEWKALSEATPQEKKLVREKKVETSQIMRFKIGTVFDISQTNYPIDKYPEWLHLGYASEQHSEMYQCLKGYAESLGLNVSEQKINSVTLHGYYIPDTSEIKVNNLLGDNERFATLLHEMSHGLLQHGKDKTNSEAYCEVQADALTIMFFNKFGVEISDGTKHHLTQSYQEFCDENSKQKKENSAEIEKLLGKVHAVFRDYSYGMEHCLEKHGIFPTAEKTQDRETAHTAEEEVEMEI